MAYIVILSIYTCCFVSIWLFWNATGSTTTELRVKVVAIQRPEFPALPQLENTFE